VSLLLMAPLFRFIPLPVISALILSSVFSMTNWQEVLGLMEPPHCFNEMRYGGLPETLTHRVAVAVLSRHLVQMTV
jgi:hypothetical protein